MAPTKAKARELTVTAVSFGPSGEDVARASEAALASSRVSELLRGTDHRLLSFLPHSAAGAKARRPPAVDQFVAEIYDYTNDRTLTLRGRMRDPDEVSVEESNRQPLPSDEEFAAAVQVLRDDPDMAAQIRRENLVPYQPMPPLISTESAAGDVSRVIAVGLVGEDEVIRQRIVGVRLKDNRIIREVPGAVQTFTGTCGPTPAWCNQTGNTGQAWITVKRGSRTLWHFLALRPAASSGTNGSGIELRYVDYRGKRVLYQAHVPILNILYDPSGPGGCGPTYRDWQNGETCFQANGVDVATGFRLCPTPAQTILDSGVDGGNFRGVALYVQGDEVVLVSQMQAGWYRYITEWRLAADGTIRPRFGFSATDNGCTCHLHTHHVYWRLDFDIETAGNNLVEEFNNPPLFPPHHWHKKRYEIRRQRDIARHRRWRVTNATSHEGYEIIPGAADGTSDPYGVGDVWVLRYHPGEIDDGQGFTTVPGLSMEHIDKFLTGEVVEDQDVVLWYAAHFRHDPAHAAGEWVGPELKPT